MVHETPLWQPSAERIAAARLSSFMAAVRRRWQVDCGDYASLWRWSVDQPEAFWTSVWEECRVLGERGSSVRRKRRPHARRPLVPAGAAQLRRKPAATPR
jgi:acetoacetyl-CoA synthetase